MLPMGTCLVAHIIVLVIQIDVELNTPLGGGRINHRREPDTRTGYLGCLDESWRFGVLLGD
jgi:hypothetical protein